MFVPYVLRPGLARPACAVLWVVRIYHPNGAGLGAWVDEALSLRCAVSVSWAFFRVVRASEIPAFTEADVVVDELAGVFGLKIRCRKNDQPGVGQMACVAAVPAW